MSISETNRRPLKTRSQAWVRPLAHLCIRCRLTPNRISLLSVGFAVGAARAFFLSPVTPALLLVAALFIQLRLLANMMDGVVATEGLAGTAAGPLFNELPDRFSDVLILASAGYAIQSPLGIALGWLCACGALITACIRFHGTCLTKHEDFSGPGAKPQRMFILTVTCLAGAAISSTQPLLIGLAGILILTTITIVRRTKGISKSLHLLDS